MILSIFILVVIGLIAYMHWIQGLLSGLISVVLALIAACMAVSYFEPLAEMLSGGKFHDQSQGVCLLAIFALAYLIPRVLFDKLVPGNIRIPSTMDKIGGAVCGLIAGIFATGIVAIAFQSLPVGPSVLGYARYALKEDTQLSVPSAGEGNRAVDRYVYKELQKDTIDKDASHLLIPVDDMVLGLVSHISNKGSMSTGKPLTSIHPDLLQEYFGQRVGVEIGAKHTVSNKGSTQVSAEKAVLIKTPIPAQWAEYQEIRKSDAPKQVGPESGQLLVAVELKFSDDAADQDDHLVRLAPAAVRICGKVGDEFKNFFPIGTFENGKAWLNKPDDYLIIKGSHSAWFLFKLDEALVIATKTETRFADDTFIEAKRLAKMELSGVKVTTTLPKTDEKSTPMRKHKLRPTKPQVASTDQPEKVATNDNPNPPENTDPKPPDNTNPPAMENGWDESPLEKPVVSTLTKLPIGVNTGNADADAVVATTAASGETKAKKWDSLEINTKDPASTFTELPKGGYAVADLLVPPDMRMIQVTLTPKKGKDSWAWLENFGDFSVVDGEGNAHKANGVYATINQAGGVKKLLCSFKSSGEVGAPPKDDGQVSSVTFIYTIPKTQKAKEMRYQGKEGGLPLEK